MKYRVTLQETILYTVYVEADDESCAVDAACETWADSETPTKDFEGRGEGVELFSIVARP
jgi:hypothetical protein